MHKINIAKLLLELIWWVITAFAAWAVLQPIHQAMHVWPYQNWNIFFTVVLITLTRYIFLLRFTFLADRQVLKVVLMLLMFPLTFKCIEGVNSFVTYIEDYTWEPLTGHLPGMRRTAIEEYIWGEMLFWGVGSIIAAPVFAGRMMLSVWRMRNRGTV